MQETFFRKLHYVEQAYTYKNTYYDENNIPIKYSDYAQQTLRKLIRFIEDAEFTNKKSSKFICKNWRCRSKELQELWEQECGKTKSNSAFRAQISATSKSLYLLFGEDFAYDFMDQNVSYIDGIIDAYKIGSCTFTTAFPEGVVNEVGNGVSERQYEFKDLQSELAVLKNVTNLGIRKKLSTLDKDKLLYIKNIMNQPLTVNDSISIEKVKLLQELKLSTNIPGYCKPAVSLKHTLSSMQMEVAKEVLLKNIGNKRVDTNRIEELKGMLFTMCTKEGFTEYLSQFSSEEIKQAIELVNKGE